MPRLSKALALACAAAAIAVTLSANAQTTPPFMTVDALEVRLGELRVTGVVQGNSAPSTATATWQYATGTDAQKIAAYEHCHKMLLLALARPGQYVAQVGYNVCNVALVAP